MAEKYQERPSPFRKELMKILLDSNIIIYATKPEYPNLRKKLKSVLGDYCVSDLTRLEVLGYHLLTDKNKQEIELFFANTHSIIIDEYVIMQAIKLRQSLKISLGDSIIAASALHHNLELWTNNIIDFEGINQVRLFNPLIEKK
jgi:predicted nucleic acid-binding protein